MNHLRRLPEFGMVRAIVVRVVLLQSVIDAEEVGLRLVHSYAGPQPADGLKGDVAA
jgi:hypothetical protein